MSHKGEEGRRQLLSRGTGELRPLECQFKLGSMKTNLCTKAPTPVLCRRAGSLQTKHLQSHLWVARTFQGGFLATLDRPLTEGSFNNKSKPKKSHFYWLVSSKPLPRFKFLMSHCHLMSDACRSEEKGSGPAKGLSILSIIPGLFPESDVNDNRGRTLAAVLQQHGFSLQRAVLNKHGPQPQPL